MKKSLYLKSALAGGVSVFALSTAANAANFNIPGGDLETALNAYSMQAVIPLIVSDEAIKGAHTRGAKGELTADAALSRILEGTGFSPHRTPTGAIAVVQDEPVRRVNELMSDTPIRVAEAASAGIESVVVTSSKIKGDIQTVPIAITALSQEQLTSRQIAGGPDLVKEVPNLTFSKTNFTGYNIQIRGIGTQAISVTTDPAVAVAFNDIPFLRNHFFEQEFYDVSQVEVLRGPQGTLYGRNATAGVVNVVSAKPTDQFEAMASADFGNYHNRRFEGMINIPIVDDRADLRIAGEWTKRDGYSFNELTNAPIDGRDLWSGRVSLGFKPTENLQTTLVWEHFSENDDRLRSGKQLCKTAPIPGTVEGVVVGGLGDTFAGGDYLSQGCLPTGLYSADAFQVPNGFSLPFYSSLTAIGLPVRGGFDVYSETTQSHNLRDIQSELTPVYKAKNDTFELNTDYNVTPSLTFTSQTGYNHDLLWSTEDYNRYNTAPGVYTIGDGTQAYHGVPFTTHVATTAANVCLQSTGTCQGLPVNAPCTPNSSGDSSCVAVGVFCDPQLGCSDRLVAEDLSNEHAWQLSQEFRLASKFSGPLNFSVGGSYLHYETEENYYVFINTLSLFSLYDAEGPYIPGVTDNLQCTPGGTRNPTLGDPHSVLNHCPYMDPNPIPKLDNEGHNYFLSQNPYTLNSYAGFGEVYYNVAQDLKLTGGLRWTDDQKHFLDIPSEVLVPGYGYTVTDIIDQQWKQLTGRAAADWTPKLDFTDQTLMYASYAHGYKAGGANPPGATFPVFQATHTINPIHPLTFKPEFIDAFELGTKNTLLDGALTLNGDAFYYNYKNYQISRIVDRTSINDNFNATVRGAELEASWEPAPGLKFNFAGGYENAVLDRGDQSIDLMDRTAGHPGWMVVKPFVTDSSNCILPLYVVANLLIESDVGNACNDAYTNHFDPVTDARYVAYPIPDPSSNYRFPLGYVGFDPVSPTATNPDNYLGIDAGPAPNNGEGFEKDLSGNQLPNAPHFTTSLAADYTMPVSEDWAATLHSDFYWQSQSWARVFNDRPYDKLRGYSSVNLALILTSASGWQVMGYLKNVFNTTAITGDFLNSDDSALTTNVFLTDPRLYGVRVTKNL